MRDEHQKPKGLARYWVDISDAETSVRIGVWASGKDLAWRKVKHALPHVRIGRIDRQL